MRAQAVFYYAGCARCGAAEQRIGDAADPARFGVEIVHPGETRPRIGEAEFADVISVPALVISGQPFHVNVGAAIADLN